MSRTFSAAIKNIKFSSLPLLTIALVFFCATSVRAQGPTLSGVLAARKAALAALGVRAPKSLEVSGVLEGSGLQGVFHSWLRGDDARYDEQFGVREESSLRIGDHEYVVNQSGNVRELNGLLLSRQRTEDFIETDGFVSQPQYDTFDGEKQLSDGRSVYEIVVKPPDGQSETLDLDSKTLMIDRISYDEEDGTSSEDYFDYKTFHGALVAQRELDSNGDHGYDIMRAATEISVDRPIDAAVFAVPQNSMIQTDKPVTVPIIENGGHYYTKVHVGTRDYTFLIDTGAQAVVFGTRVAAEQGIKPEGKLEVTGAQRTGGMGMAPYAAIQIGGATLPVRVVTVFDLRGVTGAFDADGVLGYPFFASAEVTIDPVARTMTFAQPGRLKVQGEEVPVDGDRQLVEIHGKVNGADGRFVIDTGNSTELLLFGPFMQAHPYLVQFGNRTFANDYGVGGAARAVNEIVDELDLANFHLYNRYASVMLTTQGAFADRFDAGNIGMGVLKNFVMTFDLADGRMYLQRSSAYDDGRYRTAHTDPLPAIP